MKSKFTKMSPLDLEEENFWPSFADIMMLIVMVFLMVLVVLVIKNWDLISKLKMSIEAEQQIAAAANLVAEENKKYQVTIDEKNQEIASLRLLLLSTNESLEEVKIQLEASQEAEKSSREKLIILGREKQDLENALAQSKIAKDNLSKELDLKSQIIISLEKDMSTVKEDFKDLKYKYDKLVRPARSPKGKTVIEVSLVKQGSSQTIRVKEPGQGAVVRSASEMHQILSRYQKKDPSRLYLKIIFPKESLISHQDAWNFTNRLLQKYDYYYQ